MKRKWVKLWRKSKDSTIFNHPGMWKLWCLCLMNANHKEADVSIPGILEPVKVMPGQFITGRYSLHRDYHQADINKRYRRKAPPTPYTLIRWLQTLQSMQMLSIKTYNKYSIITICSWDEYQNNDHQVSIRRASSEHKQELIKNEKEIYMSIPFTEIQETYHEILSELPGIQKWSPARQTALKARWESGIKNQNGTPINTIQYWEELFNYSRGSEHLMGKNNRGWKANVDFIIKESSFLKIIEGQYHK